MAAVVCVDFGSTFTKAALVDLERGAIVAAASHPTTLPGADGTGDVLEGYDACLASLVAEDARAADAEVLACSSAGGGLRIAVVGNEELVTAEAGRRVALSSGGKVVAVRAVSRDDDLADLDDPDVVLLTGGTDGGNADPLLAAARGIVDGGWRGPVVVAGNVEAQTEVAALLGGLPVVLADNVVPRIGVLAPDSARAAIREMFLTHVIGGKHLSSRGLVDGSPDGSVDGSGDGHAFTAMVRGATPDVVLTGVELLSRGLGPEQPGAGDVVVVDVGGATTDVHSVVELDPEDAGLARDVVALTPVTRTVEGDLGMRWSAVSTVQEAGLTELVDAAATAARGSRLPPGRRPAARGRGARGRRGDRPGRGGPRPQAARGTQQGRGQPRGARRRAHGQGPARGRPARRLGRRAAARRRRRRTTRAHAEHRRARRGRVAAATGAAGRRGPRLRARGRGAARRRASRGGTPAGAPSGDRSG